MNYIDAVPGICPTGLTSTSRGLAPSAAPTRPSRSMRSIMRAERLYPMRILRCRIEIDTVRISLAADPVEEVKVGWDLLKSLRLRSRGINFVACPSCSRQNFDVIGTINELERRLEDVRAPLDVAVIGCYVNGPGESREVDVGVTGSSPANMIFVDGKPHHKVESGSLIDDLERTVREALARKAAAAEAAEELIARG